MIYTQPSSTFETAFYGFGTGLVGVCGARIESTAGVVVLARTVAGIVESPAGSGIYLISLQAPALSGQYTIIFDDGAIPLTPSDFAVDELTVNAQGQPVVLVPGVQNYLPSVSQVAEHIMARTKDQYGKILGTFNASTTPTDVQVSALITTAGNRVADVIGDTVPLSVVQDVSDIVALRAAMMVELSYFADQVSTSRSSYPLLEAEYEREFPRVQGRVESTEIDDGTIQNQPTANRPSYSFPPAVITMTRKM